MRRDFILPLTALDSELCTIVDINCAVKHILRPKCSMQGVIKNNLNFWTLIFLCFIIKTKMFFNYHCLFQIVYITFKLVKKLGVIYK